MGTIDDDGTVSPFPSAHALDQISASVIAPSAIRFAVRSPYAFQRSLARLDGAAALYVFTMSIGAIAVIVRRISATTWRAAPCPPVNFGVIAGALEIAARTSGTSFF